MSVHLKEIRDSRAGYVHKVEEEVKKRLTTGIAYWDKQAGIFSGQAAGGKPNARLNADRAVERVNNLEKRLKVRLDELALERNTVSKPPLILGGVWIVPRAMAQANASGLTSVPSEEGREEIERIAMTTIMQIEKELGNTPKDVSKDNLGYDIESKPLQGSLRFIEVKGRAAGKTDITVTHNEMKIAANSPDKCVLAVVVIDGSKRNVVYFTNWIDAGPFFAESKRTLELKKLRLVSRVALEREIYDEN
jgi:hypothetical protein